MHFGVLMFPTDYAIRPDDLARELEARGFESFWVPEHTHIPTSRRTPWPGGGELPREYRHTYDPFVALATAAAVTTRLKVATGICLVIERDPIVTAKEVASLDHLSRGRFLFGVGGGWNAEEMEHHGTPFRTRWRIMRERILAMKQLWTQDEAEFHGEHVRFEKSWAWPKPVQKPHPPILVGGDGPTTFDRVVEYGDGWMPLGYRVGDLTGKLATLRERWAKAGRDPRALDVTIVGFRPDAPTIERLRAAGVTRAVFDLPAAPRDEVLPRLDAYAALVRG
ncbi:MAG TPA: LLM class F420-dependent oxidoreductase [Candidatus Tectomicrobia bacterium]|nr:LLM class F420-dependent oxidoreductase [Candidatus Tectomicrobia bacterium]